MSKQFSREEVKKHNKEGDCWIIVDTVVYDVSKFVGLHPGGEYALLDKDVAGQDATEAFFGLHKSEVLKKYKRLVIGTISNEKPEWILPEPGQLSTVPFAEPGWLSRGYHSPYYNDSHRALQKAMREFHDQHVLPDAMAREKDDKRPTVELIQKMGDTYINHMRLGPGKHLHGLKLPGGIDGKDYDYFHEMIVTQELARHGQRGYADGMQGGMVIGLPPVMNFGSEELKKKIIPEVLAGKKFISLAISEAYAGSDVAGLRTVAKKTEDGKHWIINGSKKWITNGHFSDYFSVGCRTGKNKLTMILVERVEGVDTKIIKSSYSSTAGTAYITFDNVKVPVENTLGKEGDGLRVILSNFNHERWIMACGSCRGTRMAVEQCFIWAHVRKVFGKPLIAQPVIRQKFGNLFARIEATQAFLEHVTYQMTKMNYGQQSDLLAGHIGVLKAYCTQTAGEAASECVQIMGGRGITKGAMGGGIESFQRTQKFDAILGGAEEVLYDLGVKQAMRKMPKTAL